MDIWDWLEPWWAWWSGFTSLFDWSAIGAMGTMAAVMIALDQAGRASRVEARQGMGVFTVLIGSLDSIHDLLKSASRNQLQPAEAALVLEEQLIERALKTMDRVIAQNPVHLGIADYLGALPLALESLQTDLPAVAAGHAKGRDVSAEVEFIGEALDDFRERRALLQIGPWGTRVVTVARWAKGFISRRR